MPKNISTLNDFFFGSDGRSIAPLLPVVITTKEQAFRAAAWIATMAEILPSESDTPPTFSDVLSAVENT